MTTDSSGRILIAGSRCAWDERARRSGGYMLFMALDDIGVITALGGAARTRGWHEGAYDIGVRSDGRIVLAGQSYRHADGSDVNRVAVVVLDPGGSPVTPVITPDLRSSTDEWATGLVIDGADRAVLAGLTRQGPTPR